MGPQLRLVRLEMSGQETLGALLLDGRIFCLTLEPPSLGNVRDKSCIPAGSYRCRRVVSPRFGPTFEVCAVPSRSEILFHAGNTARDTRGCILVGTGVGSLGGDRAVLGSREAFGLFLDALEGRDDPELMVAEVRWAENAGPDEGALAGRI
ncbi:MAG: DUF5675 family protein [Desulfovibrionaceae bacterium]|nr:DUF5675 family protein [Desulfovibrionaceae bacterium]